MTEAEKVAATQALLEAKRVERGRVYRHSPRPSKALLDAPETMADTHTCACGKTFEREVWTLNGRSVGPVACPDCLAEMDANERQWVAGHPDRPASVVDAMGQAGVNIRKHGTLALADMPETPAVSAAHAFVDDVLGSTPTTYVRGLWFHGEQTGAGKTQLAACVVRELLQRGYQGSVVFDRARALINTLQDRYGKGDVDATIDVRRRAGLWVLDDAGTEKPTPDAFRMIEDILDAREGHPMLWTSNPSPEGLASFWADKDVAGRFRSRIGPANFRYVEIVGTDRRFLRPRDAA